VSEGGNRAVMSAAKLKAITNLVVIGSGGLQQFDKKAYYLEKRWNKALNYKNRRI
jgi:enoyl reductase-like protein